MTGGRGLSIVDALASAWGVLRAGDGKVVGAAPPNALPAHLTVFGVTSSLTPDER